MPNTIVSDNEVAFTHVTNTDHGKFTSCEEGKTHTVETRSCCLRPSSTYEFVFSNCTGAIKLSMVPDGPTSQRHTARRCLRVTTLVGSFSTDTPLLKGPRNNRAAKRRSGGPTNGLHRQAPVLMATSFSCGPTPRDLGQTLQSLRTPLHCQ